MARKQPTVAFARAHALMALQAQSYAEEMIHRARAVKEIDRLINRYRRGASPIVSERLIEVGSNSRS